MLGCKARGPDDVPFDRRTGAGYVVRHDGDSSRAGTPSCSSWPTNAYGGLSPDTYQHFEHRANLAREDGDGTTYGDSPLATSSFRVYHARRMSKAIVVADSRAIDRALP